MRCLVKVTNSIYWEKEQADVTAKTGHQIRGPTPIPVAKSDHPVIWKESSTQLWSSPSHHHRFLHNIDPRLLLQLPSDLPREVERLIHRPRFNAAYTSSYKFKLGGIDSPDRLACGGCPQTIAHNFCSCAVHFQEQRHLKNTLKLLSKSKYNVAEILGPWNTSGRQPTATKALVNPRRN